MTSASSIRARRVRNWIVVGALVTLLALVLLGYPPLLERALLRFGVRGSAVGLLLLSLLSLATPRLTRVEHGGVVAWALPVVLLGAVVFDSERWLRAVPAAVYATLAAACFASLRGQGSLIEEGARWLVPEVPDFVRPYCRTVTALWGVFFAASALCVVVLSGDEAAWALFTGRGFGACVLGLSLVEFFVRKTWFRYYFHGGPVDWLWSRLFPAENTERGRHSLALIEQYRREVAQAAREEGRGT